MKTFGPDQDTLLNFPSNNLFSLKYSNNSEGHHSLPSEKQTPISLRVEKSLAFSVIFTTSLTYIDYTGSNKNPRTSNCSTKVLFIARIFTCCPSALETYASRFSIIQTTITSNKVVTPPPSTVGIESTTISGAPPGK